MSFELAFEQVLGEVAKPTGHFYVVLWQDSPYYGGPEEGGWWGTDRIPLQYASFATEEAAEKAKSKIDMLAQEMSADAKRRHGQYCLEQCEWLEARGLDDSYLREDDGEDSYSVSVQNTLPEARLGCRHYE
jgi:hypothetical protein